MQTYQSQFYLSLATSPAALQANLRPKCLVKGNNAIVWLQLNEKVRPRGNSDNLMGKKNIQLSHDNGAHQKVGDFSFRRPNWDIRLPTKETSQHHSWSTCEPLVSVEPGGAKELGMVYFRNQRVPEISQITYQFIEFDVKASVSYFTTEMTWHQTQRGSTNVNVLVVIIEHLQFIGKAYESLIFVKNF